MDRKALAQWTKRSENTIRLRCPVAEYRDRRPLYDVDVCEALLDKIATRRRAAA